MATQPHMIINRLRSSSPARQLRLVTRSALPAAQHCKHVLSATDLAQHAAMAYVTADTIISGDKQFSTSLPRVNLVLARRGSDRTAFGISSPMMCGTDHIGTG